MVEKAATLNKALHVCCQYEAKLKVTGRPDGATASDFADYIITVMNDLQLERKWLTSQPHAP